MIKVDRVRVESPRIERVRRRVRRHRDAQRLWASSSTRVERACVVGGEKKCGRSFGRSVIRSVGHSVGRSFGRSVNRSSTGRPRPFRKRPTRKGLALSRDQWDHTTRRPPNCPISLGGGGGGGGSTSHDSSSEKASRAVAVDAKRLIDRRSRGARVRTRTRARSIDGRARTIARKLFCFVRFRRLRALAYVERARRRKDDVCDDARIAVRAFGGEWRAGENSIARCERARARETNERSAFRARAMRFFASERRRRARRARECANVRCGRHGDA